MYNKKGMNKRLKTKSVPKLFYFYFVSWFSYFAYIWSHAIQIKPDGWYAAYLPHWADGAAHLSYMASTGYRTQFPQFHPLFINHPFSYSYAADYLSGTLLRFGISLPIAYNITGIIFSAFLLLALWKLVKLVTQSNKLTFISLNLFLFSGGFGWIHFLSPGSYQQANQKAVGFFATLTQIPNTDIVWLNPIVGELIPQRAIVLGMTIGGFLLYYFIRHFIDKKSTSNCKLFLAGTLFGLMPIVHPHTALVLAAAFIIFGLWSIKQSKNRSRTIVELLAWAVPAISLGLILSQHILPTSVSQTFFKFHPGWLVSNTATNWFRFWFDNWGLLLPLALIGTYIVSNRLKLILLPFWLWFTAANLFLFQPYDWDNAKILTWVNLFFTIPTVFLLKKIWAKPKIYSKAIVIILMVSLMFSGAFDAVHLLDTQSKKIRLLSTEEIVAANFIRKRTLDDAVILTSTTHRNWVSVATGRQILCGYLGWMWTYGIEASGRQSDIAAIYKATPQAPRLIESYGIDYIVIGPEERNEFKVNQAFFDANYPLFYQSQTIKVYQVN